MRGFTFCLAALGIIPLLSGNPQRGGHVGGAAVTRAHGPFCRDSSVFFLRVPGHRVPCPDGLRAMSIETLLEAARYLEWQAQQQQQIKHGKLNSRVLHCGKSSVHTARALVFHGIKALVSVISCDRVCILTSPRQRASTDMKCRWESRADGLYVQT